MGFLYPASVRFGLRTQRVDATHCNRNRKQTVTPEVVPQLPKLIAYLGLVVPGRIPVVFG